MWDIPTKIKRHLDNEVSRNIFWTSIGKISELLVSLIIAIAVTRYMGPANYGVVVIAMAITGIFTQMIIGGLWFVCTNRVANSATTEEKHRWEDTTRQILTKRSWIWTGIAMLTACILPKEYGLPLAIAATSIPATIGESRAWTHHASLDSKKTILSDRTGQIIGALTQITLIMLTAPAWAFALTLPATAWAKTFILNRQRICGKANYDDLKTFEKEAAGIRLGVVIKHLANTLPGTLIGIITPAAAGFLAVGQRWTAAASNPAQIYCFSAIPKTLSGRGWEADGKKAWMHTCFLGAISTICIGLNAFWFIPTLHSSAYAGAVWPTILLAINIPLAAGIPLLETTLQKLRKRTIQTCWLASSLFALVALMLAITCWNIQSTQSWATIAAAMILLIHATTTIGMLIAIRTHSLQIDGKPRKKTLCKLEPTVSSNENFK